MNKLPLLVLAITVATRAVAQERLVSNVDQDVSTPPLARTLLIEIAPNIFDQLDALADTLRVESVRCLIGTVRGDRAVVDLAWQPAIESSGPNSVAYQSCPGATIALWHNHPELPGVEAEYACYLSAVDLREASDPRAPVVQIVQVNSRVACWWSKNQVLRATDQVLLWPLQSQRRGRHVTLADACSMWRALPPCTFAEPIAAAQN